MKRILLTSAAIIFASMAQADIVADIPIGDTNTIDLNDCSGEVCGDVVIDPNANNTLVATANGLFVLPVPITFVPFDAANGGTSGVDVFVGGVFQTNLPDVDTDTNLTPSPQADGTTDFLDPDGNVVWTHVPSTPYDDTAITAAVAANTAAIAADADGNLTNELNTSVALTENADGDLIASVTDAGGTKSSTALALGYLRTRETADGCSTEYFDERDPGTVLHTEINRDELQAGLQRDPLQTINYTEAALSGFPIGVITTTDTQTVSFINPSSCRIATVRVSARMGAVRSVDMAPANLIRIGSQNLGLNPTNTFDTRGNTTLRQLSYSPRYDHQAYNVAPGGTLSLTFEENILLQLPFVSSGAAGVRIQGNTRQIIFDWHLK